MSTDKVAAIWHVYVRKGIAVVPTVAQTEAGYYLDVDPVHASSLDDFPSLATAIEKAIAAGNPRVPTPTRAAFPKPVVLKPARVKSWKELEKRGACFTILLRASELEIAETGRSENGEWVDAPNLSQTLAATSSSAEIARRIANRTAQRSDLS